MATTPARFSAADRRQQILAVATALFARQGFQGTTTKLIAERAGVTEALIFRHFRSKDDLYWAVIEDKIKNHSPQQRMHQRLSAKGSEVDVLAGLAQDILERRAKDQTLSRLLLYSALERHRLSNRFFRSYVAGYYEVLASYIERQVGRGKYRNVDPLLAARGFLGMVIYQSWVQELFGGKRYQKLSVQQISRSVAEIWLQGMLRPGTSGNGSSRTKNGNHAPLQESTRVAH